MSNQLSIILTTLLAMSVFIACQTAETEPPPPVVETVIVERPVEVEVERAVTVIATVEVTRQVEIEVTREVFITATVEVFRRPETVIEFWTTDNQADQIEAYETVAEAYMADNPDVEVRIVPIEAAGLVQRLETAQAADRLPDIIRLGVEQLPLLTDPDLLDRRAAATIIGNLGEADFGASLLQLVADPTNEDGYIAVPFDGQLSGVWYRQDLFAEADLEPPTTWAALLTANCTLPDETDVSYGISLGFDRQTGYGHRLFEQIALSNNAWPLDEMGDASMNSPEMVEAIDWYIDLLRCAVPIAQTEAEARQSYLEGEIGMIFDSTAFMQPLVGTVAATPTPTAEATPTAADSDTDEAAAESEEVEATPAADEEATDTDVAAEETDVEAEATEETDAEAEVSDETSEAAEEDESESSTEEETDEAEVEETSEAVSTPEPTSISSTVVITQTAFAPVLSGPNAEALYGHLSVAAVVDGADPAAREVVEFFLTEGYPEILSLTPTGRVPVQQSDVTAWQESSPYLESYSVETLESIAQGYAVLQRWLYRPDYDTTAQAVIQQLEQRHIIPRLLNELATDESLTADDVANLLQTEVEAILAE